MSTADFLAPIHPFAAMEPQKLAAVAADFVTRPVHTGDAILKAGEPVDALYVIEQGEVEVTDGDGTILSRLGPRNAFGERGLTSNGIAPFDARATSDGTVLALPADRFRALCEADGSFRDFFARVRPLRPPPRTLAHTSVASLMTANPITIAPTDTIADAARLLRDNHMSSLIVTDNGTLAGILTIRDISGRVVAAGLDPSLPVSEAMTKEPITLPPDAIGTDVLHLMVERGIGHIPVVDLDGVVGIVTQTDLTRFQAETSADLVGDIASAADVEALAAVTRRIPQLLAKLVGAGNRHNVVTRLITDVADTVTRRLLSFAEAELGAPPVPYLWLACGSQGRREQTGVSDQDNCLFLSDDATEEDDAYFARLAQIVSTGLDACGYVFCPGDMMATNKRWRQPVRVWRQYFRGWIDKPDPMAQMLASVMFDLRPIGGEVSLYEGLQAETLQAASKNSIFVAHMLSNSLKHAPPLGLFRGLATLRSGEHRNAIDLKLNGVVPVIDLGRIYALRGRLTEVNTRARIKAARAVGSVSRAGGRDLMDAYDLIAQTRLEHQAQQVRQGGKPDNFMRPSDLSEFERSRLRDAFVVVRQMQSAATQGQGVM